MHVHVVILVLVVVAIVAGVVLIAVGRRRRTGPDASGRPERASVLTVVGFALVVAGLLGLARVF